MLDGFPHSDICGSLVICTSPQLFAAYHVFRRLLVPRHPPYALFCLTFISLLICVLFRCIALHLSFEFLLVFLGCLDCFLFVTIFFILSCMKFSRYISFSLTVYQSLTTSFSLKYIIASKLLFNLAATYFPIPSPV